MSNKKKKSDSNYKDLAIQMLADLIVGIILLLISKLIE